MKVSELIEKLAALPPDAEIHDSADWDHNAIVWVEVGGEDVYLIDPDEPDPGGHMWPPP
jgi:hypothetical protein